MSQKLHDRLVRSLGLSGGTIRSSALALSGNVDIPTGYYFLAWGPYAIIWLESTRSGPAGLMAAYHCNDIGVWRGVFCADQTFDNRAELLHHVAFDRWTGPHTLVALVPSLPNWSWTNESTAAPGNT